jgi:hypothetical protein
MTLLWLISGSLESMQYVLDMEDERPPRFEFVNRDAIHDYTLRIEDEYYEHDDPEHERLRFNDMPMPVFRIADPAFRLDYFFHQGIACASLRLRRALGLTGAVICYRDIDMDQSPPAVRAQEYQAFRVLASADPIDWSRTTAEVFEIRRPDGSIRQLRLRAPPTPTDPRRVYWRDDFKPPAPLFRAIGTPWTLATDQLADKVMRAGITDLVFQDLTSDRAQTGVVLRQL